MRRTRRSLIAPSSSCWPARTPSFSWRRIPKGVFLAFALAAWLAGRRDRWWLAGLMTAGAAIVRINGLFLAAGLAVMFVLAARAAGRRIIRADALALTLPVLATAGYFGWMRATTGRWTTWFEVQERGWARTTTWPWTTLVHSANGCSRSNLGRCATRTGWRWFSRAARARRRGAFPSASLARVGLRRTHGRVAADQLLLRLDPSLDARVLPAHRHRRRMDPSSPHRWLVACCTTAGVAMLVFNTTTFLFDQWSG